VASVGVASATWLFSAIHSAETPADVTPCQASETVCTTRETFRIAFVVPAPDKMMLGSSARGTMKPPTLSVRLM